ncbi:hypothetical protein JCM5350_005250 [Sporobolomyces pararoseus]
MPTLLDLPDETLLAIFLQPRLSYFDLKRVSRTCKKLHAIEQDESLDAKLFRKGLPPSPPRSKSKSKSKKADRLVLCKKGDNVKYHPIFAAVESLVETSLDDVFGPVSGPKIDDGQGGFKYGGDREVQVEELACLDEYATSPPCRSLQWFMGGSMDVQNSRGVTGREALTAAVDSWNAEVDDYEPDSDDSTFEADEKPCYMQLLSDHRFWEGMSYAKCEKDDEVCFRPTPFGS